MGDLRTGDTVFGRNGEPVRVLAAHQVMEGRECCEVEFDTGDRVVCDTEHLWLTFTARDMIALLRRSPEWRAKRRASRPSRATGKRSAKFTAAVAERNSNRPPSTKPPPSGAVRTTAEIAATIHTGKQANHAVPLASALQLPNVMLPLDPYLLGVWLGDGATDDGRITTADAAILDSFHMAGFRTRHYSAYDYGVYGFKAVLRSAGVLGNKHVPPAYLRASSAQRLAILQGLMDTDGYACPDGSVEFDNTNIRIAEAVYELVVSLGWRPSWCEGRAKLYGRDCGPKYRVVWRPTEPVFRLERKAARHRTDNRRSTNGFRYIVAVRPVASVPVRCITVEAADSLYLCGRGMIPTHNTQLLIGLAVTAHRNSLILRRTAKDAKSLSKAIQSLGYGSWKWVGNGGELRTPDGRTVEVGGCQHAGDEEGYQGQAHDLKAFDELPHFLESQYKFIIGWNRPLDPRRHPNQRCRVVGAGNPPTNVEGEWVLRHWRAWLDPTAGKVAAPGELRWYTTVKGEEVECADGRPFTVDGSIYTPKSRTFIPARLEDNPELMATGYAATLEAMPEPLRSKLRYGDMMAAREDDRWQLVPTKWVALAQRRWAERQKAAPMPLTALGVDVAMQGSDKFVIAPRHGRTVANLVKRKGTEVQDGQAAVALIVAAGGGDPKVKVNVDAIGVGKSAYDLCQASGLRHVKAVVVSNSTGYRDPKVPALKFGNVRAAMMWNVRALLDPEGGPDDTRLALPPDPELMADLTAPRYQYRTSGVFVEPKEEVRQRIGRSTDAGDAVALACWEQPGVTVAVIEV